MAQRKSPSFRVRCAIEVQLFHLNGRWNWRQKLNALYFKFNGLRRQGFQLCDRYGTSVHFATVSKMKQLIAKEHVAALPSLILGCLKSGVVHIDNYTKVYAVCARFKLIYCLHSELSSDENLLVCFALVHIQSKVFFQLTRNVYPLVFEAHK